MADADDLADRAAALDESDPLGHLRARFLVPAESDVVAYLDGNSLGRPLIASAQRLAAFAGGEWGGRLIRGWDEGWLDLPLTLGDRVARAALGSGPGQTVVADSTTVLLYKLARAAAAARPGRDEIVLDTADFPTDRFVLDGVAQETGRTLRPLPAGDSPVHERLAAVVGPRTALVVLSHVDYRSARIADLPAATAVAQAAGALVLWDLSHSVGVLPVGLDAARADLAVGCTYKYLNGGPGAPAFAWVRRDLQEALLQPVQGWMGAADVFAMADAYRPAAGMRRFLSGTPPVVGMLAMQDMVDLIAEAGLAAVRAKSIALTGFAVEFTERVLAPLGVRLASPVDPSERGGHVLIEHPAFERIVPGLWRRGVIPDFRFPAGLRMGLSPLSTGFVELHRGLLAVQGALVAA